MIEVGDVIEWVSDSKTGETDRGLVTYIGKGDVGRIFRFMYRGSMFDTWDNLSAVGSIYRVVPDEEVFLPAIGSRYIRKSPRANSKPVEILGYDLDEKTITYKIAAGTGLAYLRLEIDAFLKEYEPC